MTSWLTSCLSLWSYQQRQVGTTRDISNSSLYQNLPKKSVMMIYNTLYKSRKCLKYLLPDDDVYKTFGVFSIKWKDAHEAINPVLDFT